MWEAVEAEETEGKELLEKISRRFDAVARFLTRRGK